MHEDDKLARNVKNNESAKSSAGLRLMKLIEQMQRREWNPYNIEKYIEAVLFFTILTFIALHFQFDESHKDKGNGYHKEILPSNALCYIKNNELVKLSDGAYPVAMPSQDSTLDIDGKTIFPMLLILVPELKDNQITDFELYPLNIHVEDAHLLCTFCLASLMNMQKIRWFMMKKSVTQLQKTTDVKHFII